MVLYLAILGPLSVFLVGSIPSYLLLSLGWIGFILMIAHPIRPNILTGIGAFVGTFLWLLSGWFTAGYFTT